MERKRGGSGMRKKRPLHRKGNVIVFPGTYEKMINDAFDAFEVSQYEEAANYFEKARRLRPDETSFYGPYAIALYEMRAYKEAKEVIRPLIEKSHRGMPHYAGTVELYVTICIQLREYEEVNRMIARMFDEGSIPLEMMKKFEYLRDLNRRLQKRYEEELLPTLDVYTFLSQTTEEQIECLQQMEQKLTAQTAPLFQQIVKSSSVHPFVHTYALILLKKLQYSHEMNVEKFGQTVAVVPATLPLPHEQERVQAVQSGLYDYYEKEATKRQFAQQIIEKYAIYAYPFTWLDNEIEEIIEHYKVYVEQLLEGTDSLNTPLYAHLREVDEMTES